MGSRERKRAERRRRKQRSAARADGENDGVAEGAAGNGPADVTALAAEAERSRMSRSEGKDAAARAELEPLSEGERPFVVTLGAIVSALIALGTSIGWAAGIEVDGERPNALQALAPAILFAVMAAGMWRARYWAVLGFEAIMAFILLGSALSLVQAESLTDALIAIGAFAVAGAFFWFTVKALARIQMPDRDPRV